MAKSIDYKKVEMSDAEFDYYKYLVDLFTDEENNIDGRDYFKDLFEVDEDGFIILIKTDKSIPWSILFFMQQVMISQRLRIIDKLRKSGGLKDG